MEKVSQKKIDCMIKIVDTWLDYQQFMKKIPGLSIGIIYRDNIILSNGYGYSDIEQKKRISYFMP